MNDMNDMNDMNVYGSCMVLGLGDPAKMLKILSVIRSLQKYRYLLYFTLLYFILLYFRMFSLSALKQR